MKSFNNFIEEGKKCPDGEYYCNDSKKCKKIPGGYRVGYGGYLRKDNDNDSGESNGNGGNGNGGGNGGGGNGGGGGE